MLIYRTNGFLPLATKPRCYLTLEPSQPNHPEKPAGVATERPQGRGGAEGEGTRATARGEGCGGDGEPKRTGVSGDGEGTPDPRPCAKSHQRNERDASIGEGERWGTNLMLVGRGTRQQQPVRVRAGTRTRSAANDGRGLRAGATAHARWRRLGATPTLLGREALNNGGGQSG